MRIVHFSEEVIKVLHHLLTYVWSSQAARFSLYFIKFCGGVCVGWGRKGAVTETYLDKAAFAKIIILSWCYVLKEMALLRPLLDRFRVYILIARLDRKRVFTGNHSRVIPSLSSIFREGSTEEWHRFSYERRAHHGTKDEKKCLVKDGRQRHPRF